MHLVVVWDGVQLWEQVLLEGDSQLLSDLLELFEVSVVLLDVLDLVLQTLEDSDGGSVVVHSSSSLESLTDDGWGWDQVVGESVVEDTLDLEEVVSLVELLLESVTVLVFAFWCVITQDLDNWSG